MTELKPVQVFHYFKEISNIPRGSGNTKAVSDYCLAFAKKRGLFATQDEWNNIIIKKQASAGREKEPGVIIQGHLDMVTEKTPGSSHDFLKDGIELMVEGDFLTAKDTTLGADDGIAVAMGLALLADEELSHPQLEVIFTSDEETGMDGAKNIDLSGITGSFVLNLDSEEEGILTAGCAGGAKGKTSIPVKRDILSGRKYKLTVRGLRGGHSGVEIDKERVNACILMARLLKILYKKHSLGLLSLAGGGKDNAIPRECSGEIIVPDGKEGELESLVKTFEQVVREEYSVSDPEIQIEVFLEEEGSYSVLTEESFKTLLFYLNNVPDQVMHRSQNIPGLVETSLNLGILELTNDSVNICTSVRSSVGSRRERLLERLEDMAKQAGGELFVSGEYPEWGFRKESKLRDTMMRIYQEMYGEKLIVDVIHAGLECGYLLQKKPDLDIISFGPQMYDIHTTEERLSIPSVEKTYAFVKCILEQGIA